MLRALARTRFTQECIFGRNKGIFAVEAVSDQPLSAFLFQFALRFHLRLSFCLCVRRTPKV